MDCPYALIASSLVSPKLAEAEERLSNKISSEKDAKQMSLSALFCIHHFYGTGQDCFQDFGTDGLKQMGFKTSAFAFSHVSLTAPSDYSDGLLWAPPDRLFFKRFPHVFRALSELFLKFANQLVILAF